ncbi:MAG: nucleotidyltransferase domain-containing protein [Ignavibacteriales bacterium]|nr:nucleotidyltransferase domain-containing protein [Ignavibacteriales bacterium]
MNRKTIIEKLKVYKSKSDYSHKIKELGLFGSYATGKNATKSDIDVFVKLEPAKMFDLISIKNDLEKLFGKKVDIIALRKSMNEYLKNQIKQNGIYV